ncbi:zinc finger protein 76 [Aphelenchoides avenae]|nr:zinc finger protein 76 [Aphelenchus avenae]
MSLMLEPKIEPKDANEPDEQGLRSSPSVGAGHYDISVPSARAPIEVKEEVGEDVWEAIEDGPLAAETLPKLEQKCVSQNRCDSVVTHTEGSKKRKGGTFKCETCGCYRSTNQSLQRHMRIHTDDRPFKCPICGKLFRLNCTLQDHIPTHSNDR